GRRRALAALLFVVAVTAAGLAALPRAGVVPLAETVALGAARRGWARSLPPGTTVSTVVIDSSLTHSLGLEPGAPLAAVQLLDAERRPLASWRLRLGEHTAEWAVARGDVANRLSYRPPAPWLSTVAPDGSHFARRFRARFDLGSPVAAAWVVVRRPRRLPPATEVVLYRLELRP
ncbi:MAG: hypothetical protein D6696_17845, partial [Acidobacteria bacterium]